MRKILILPATLTTLEDMAELVRVLSGRGRVKQIMPMTAQIQVPFWLCRRVRRAIASRIPYSNLITVTPLSMRDHFKLDGIKVSKP